jgi:alpha 1,3-glucosidase
MGVYFPAKHLFGIPEREDSFDLGNKQYSMFATDHPQHMPNTKAPLYGSIPYLQSVSETTSAGINWVNSAHTWITLSDYEDGKYANFVSESGALEFIVYSASTDGESNRFKKVQFTNQVVTGFAPMPPVSTLGFHFSKWAPLSAEMMIERNRNFTANNFPVDVLWMDINYANQNDTGAYEYFVFNPANFTES